MYKMLLFLPAFVLPLLVSTAKVHAFTLFSQRDLNSAPGNAVPPLTEFPNSSQAEANFLSQLAASVATEDFESFTSGQSSPLSLVFPGAGTTMLLGNGLINTNSSSQSENGAYAISGSQNYLVQGGESFTIAFSQPVAGFGFYITDLGSELLLNLSLADGGVEPIAISSTESFGSNVNRQSGSVQYEGVIADTPTEYFTSIEITPQATVQLDGFAFDDLTIASPQQVEAIPEPSSLLGLVGLALCGCGVKLKFHKKV